MNEMSVLEIISDMTRFQSGKSSVAENITTQLGNTQLIPQINYLIDLRYQNSLGSLLSLSFPKIINRDLKDLSW